MSKSAPEVWYEALQSQCGILVITDSDSAISKRKLYEARKELQDPDLGGIGIYTSPDDPNELWLVKGDWDVT